MSKRKKKKIARIIIIITGMGLVVLASLLFYKWLAYEKAKFTRYPEFNIYIPDGYTIHGIDVSKHQSVIAWEEVKRMDVNDIRLGFAFIKASEGIGNGDVQFKRNWKKTKDNDIVRGAYHFFIATKDGKLQAENFIKRVDIEPGDFPPVLDVEEKYSASKAQIRKEVKKWLDVVENYYKVKPIIYTNVDFYERYLGEDFDEYPLWVAHYYQLQQPRIKREWLFWQHSDKGNVNGIINKVDFNVFNGDSSAFKSILVQ